MAGESTETESEEFYNGYEEMQVICRQAKRKLAETLKHVNATPDLEKRGQSLYALKGQWHKVDKAKMVEVLIKQVDVLNADSDDLKDFQEELLDSLKRACGSTGDADLQLKAHHVFHELLYGLEELRLALPDVASKLANVADKLRSVE